MWIQPSHSDFRFLDAQRLAAFVSNPDNFQYTRFLYPLNGFPQGNVGGNMDHTQVIMSQHHGVMFRMGVFRINFRMAGIMMPCHVDGFFAQRIGHRGVHFILHRHINDFDDILEGRFATQFAGTDMERSRFPVLHIMRDLFRFDQSQVDQINGTRFEQRLRYFFDHMQFFLQARNLFRHLDGIFHAGSIPYHQRTAGIIQFRLSQRFYRNFRAIPKRIPHGNRNNRFFIHFLFLLSSRTYYP